MLITRRFNCVVSLGNIVMMTCVYEDNCNLNILSTQNVYLLYWNRNEVSLCEQHFNIILVLYIDSNFTEWYSYGFCNSNESFIYELKVNSKQVIVCVNVIDAYMYL